MPEFEFRCEKGIVTVTTGWDKHRKLVFDQIITGTDLENKTMFVGKSLRNLLQGLEVLCGGVKPTVIWVGCAEFATSLFDPVSRA